MMSEEATPQAKEIERLKKMVWAANDRLLPLLDRPCYDHDCYDHAWWDADCDHMECTHAGKTMPS